MQLEHYRDYVALSTDDEARLRTLWPHVAPHLDEICDDFYARARIAPSTHAILEDAGLVERLKRTLRLWLRELHHGPWDAAYAQKRRRAGEVHVDVGVEHDAMFAAMSAVRHRLFRIAASAPEPMETMITLERVTQLDLALMTGRYHQRLERKAVLDSQSLLISHMPSIVLLLDRDGRVVSSTPSVAKRFGREVTDGRHYGEVLPTALVEAADLAAQLEAARQSGEAKSVGRIEIDEGASKQHFAVTIVPLQHSRGGVLLHVDDHTQAVRNESLLRRQESLAQLGALSATIAHELRNPLAGISGALQVIGESMSGDATYGPIITKVVEQIGSLDRLVSDLLAFARPRDARVNPACDVGLIVRDTVSVAAIEEPTCTIDIEGDGVCAADPDMVRQILSNLVMNALQATGPQGRVRVHVSNACILVEDDGPGLPEEIRAKLFRPFHTTKVRGTGLGLAVSHRLAGLMGAQLSHVPGPTLSGAAFELRFALAPQDEGSNRTPAKEGGT